MLNLAFDMNAEIKTHSNLAVPFVILFVIPVTSTGETA